MFGFGRNKQREIDKARAQQEFINNSVEVFMEHQLENTKIYECYPRKLEQQAVAELMMLGAIDYSAQLVKAPGEEQFLASLMNLLVSVFDYQSTASAERAASLFHAVYGEPADPAAHELMLIGGDAMAKYATAANSGDHAKLRGPSLTLTQLMRDGRQIRV